MRVLVAENIGAAGIGLLRAAGFDVDLGIGWDRAELEARIAGYHAILIRSATRVDADLLAKADTLRVVARAGVGVDNVDVEEATRRGVIVANAPQSNVITAAEHTMALMLALARNVPQAHASLTGGAWERSSFTGVELHDKTLGVLGFGRIGQLVATRAQGFGMHVIAYDPYLSEERYRELGVTRALTPHDIYQVADFVTVHLPNTKETTGFLNAAAFGQMKPGVRILNVARGPLVVDADLQAALDSGQVAGAALDVFAREPITDHPLFGYRNVVVTPHLGASTAEATERAGYQAAEQAVAALTGGAVTTAVNLPAIAADDLEAVEPFIALCSALGRIAGTLGSPTSLDAVEVEYLGRIGDRDSRLLTIQVVKGLLADHTDEEVNDVNALSLAQTRGIAVTEHSSTTAHDFTDLIRIVVRGGGTSTRVVGTVLGRRNRPHLLEAWASRFNIQLESYLAIFSYRDQPGMLGRVGTALGDAGVNIVSAAVGRRSGQDTGNEAVMVVTTDALVPNSVLATLTDQPDFFDARAVSI